MVRRRKMTTRDRTLKIMHQGFPWSCFFMNCQAFLVRKNFTEISKTPLTSLQMEYLTIPHGTKLSGEEFSRALTSLVCVDDVCRFHRLRRRIAPKLPAERCFLTA
jgi:hypothetical protein